MEDIDTRFDATNAPRYGPDEIDAANEAFAILGDGLDASDFDPESESTRLGSQILAALDAGCRSLGAILAHVARAADAAAAQEVPPGHPRRARLQHRG